MLMMMVLQGMFDADWRIRQSSVKLLGELLYLVGDTKAVGLADENDEVQRALHVSSKIHYFMHYLALFTISSLFLAENSLFYAFFSTI